MSDKKHIDRIFQEKFKDFETPPNPQVWSRIQSELNSPKKDQKKVFPFWYKIAGMAAILLVLLTVGGLLVRNNSFVNPNKTQVVDIENTLQNSNTPLNKAAVNTTGVGEISNENKNKESVYGTSIVSHINTNGLKEDFSSRSQIASEENLKTTSFKPDNNNNNTVSKKNSGENTTTKLSSEDIGNKNDTRLTENSNVKSKVTSILNSGKESTQSKTATNSIEEKNAIVAAQTEVADEKINSHSKYEIINNENQLQQFNNTHTRNGVALEEPIEVANENTNTVNGFQQLKNNTIESGVALNNHRETEIEEGVEKELNKTYLTIEEAIAANNNIIEEEKDDVINRWQVYANIAPVYYNSIGKGSHIDEQFVNNSKTGNVNASYGLNVSYNVNKKLSVRTGLSSLNLSYNTNDVILFESIARDNSTLSSLRNINLNEDNKGLTALSANNLNTAHMDNLLSPKASAAISQHISYYEIPMELNYRVGNKKFGLNLIAGFSSFILDGNEVYAELLDEQTYIGEANNIRNMSFSSNVGVGLDYKFTEKFKFNLEPTFKYQINAYENTSGDFKPYIVGVYSGISYTF